MPLLVYGKRLFQPKSTRTNLDTNILIFDRKLILGDKGLVKRRVRFGSLATCIDAACNRVVPKTRPPWLGGDTWDSCPMGRWLGQVLQLAAGISFFPGFEAEKIANSLFSYIFMIQTAYWMSCFWVEEARFAPRSWMDRVDGLLILFSPFMSCYVLPHNSCFGGGLQARRLSTLTSGYKALSGVALKFLRMRGR